MRISELLEKSAADHGGLVYRIDPRQIKDFAAGMKTYHHNADWTQSGEYPPGADIPDDMKQTATGLYAADSKFSAPYAAGNPDTLRLVTFKDPKTQQRVIYFDRRDEQRIRQHRPWLSR